MYPGAEDSELAHATIASAEGGTSVQAYFNPKDLTIDKKATWKRHAHSGNNSKNADQNDGDVPEMEFTQGEPQTLQTELLFDMYEKTAVDGSDNGDQNVYTKYIAPLMTLICIDASKKRPPMCTFTWGAWGTFKGVITGLNVKYTMFLPDGTPCRATVTLNMQQAKSAMSKKEAEEANKKESQQKGAPSDGKTSPSRNQKDGMKDSDINNDGTAKPNANVPAE
jgi:hypothetical protein